MHATSQMNLKIIHLHIILQDANYLFGKQVSGFLQNRCGVGEERQGREIVLKAQEILGEGCICSLFCLW